MKKIITALLIILLIYGTYSFYKDRETEYEIETSHIAIGDKISILYPKFSHQNEEKAVSINEMVLHEVSMIAENYKDLEMKDLVVVFQSAKVNNRYYSILFKGNIHINDNETKQVFHTLNIDLESMSTFTVNDLLFGTSFTDCKGDPPVLSKPEGNTVAFLQEEQITLYVIDEEVIGDYVKYELDYSMVETKHKTSHPFWGTEFELKGGHHMTRNCLNRKPYEFTEDDNRFFELLNEYYTILHMSDEYLYNGTVIDFQFESVEGLFFEQFVSYSLRYIPSEKTLFFDSSLGLGAWSQSMYYLLDQETIVKIERTGGTSAGEDIISVNGEVVSIKSFKVEQMGDK